MAFMTLKIIVFEKKKQKYSNLPFFLFIYMLPILINKRSQATSLAFEEVSIEKNFEGRNMALRLRHNFLASFNWVFVFCLYLLILL